MHLRSPHFWGGGRCRTGPTLTERSPSGERSGIRSLAGTKLGVELCHPRPLAVPGRRRSAPTDVRVLGAGHDVRLELGVVEGRGGADQPPVLLAAGVDLELWQATRQFVARQRASHLRAEGQGGQGVLETGWGSREQSRGPGGSQELPPRGPCRSPAPAAGSGARAGRRARPPGVRSWLDVRRSWKPGAAGTMWGRDLRRGRGSGRSLAVPRKQMSQARESRAGNGCGCAVAEAAAAGSGCRAGERSGAQGGREGGCRAGCRGRGPAPRTERAQPAPRVSAGPGPRGQEERPWGPSTLR